MSLIHSQWNSDGGNCHTMWVKSDRIALPMFLETVNPAIMSLQVKLMSRISHENANSTCSNNFIYLCTEKNCITVAFIEGFIPINLTARHRKALQRTNPVCQKWSSRTSATPRNMKMMLSHAPLHNKQKSSNNRLNILKTNNH